MASTALDPTFGVGGTVVGLPSQGAAVTTTATAVQADGKVVVVGTYNGSVGSISNPLITVQRLDADGTPDTTFGPNGEVFLSGQGGVDNTVGGSDRVLIQPDGKIVLAGAFGSTNSAAASETIVFRLNADGTPDTSFDGTGRAVISGDEARFAALALQPDGKIVAAGLAIPQGGTAGYGVARLDADGTPDTSFNGGHVLVLSTPDGAAVGASALAVGPDGKIVVVGSGNEVFVRPITVASVARLNPDGTPDTSFGPNGFTPTLIYQTVADVAVQADGKVLVAGNSNGLTFDTPSLVRLNTDGSIDSSFKPSFNVPSGPLNGQYAFSVARIAIQGDGKIVVGGDQPSRSGASFAVERFLATGATDAGFGLNGEATFNVTPTPPAGQTVASTLVNAPGLAIGPDGNIVVAGTLTSYGATGPAAAPIGVQTVVARLLPIAITRQVSGDYTGDGKSDIAAFLPAGPVYAYRPSDGSPDVLDAFGVTGAGQVIPAPGDYEGIGKTDVAAYLPQFGAFAIRPSSGVGPDLVVPFGIPGAGNTIPVPGDYDGDGKTDIAAYFPAYGLFAYRPSSGGADVFATFGIPGAGNTIPVPGDYDGSGRTEIAAFFPSGAYFAYRPAGGGNDVFTQFGIAGAGNSIPVPGDYNGDGITDLAVYLPKLGVLAYRPSNVYNPADVVEPFGIPGAGNTIPAPGDYDGDGKTDVAAYFPSAGLFAYRPSGGGADVFEPFGIPGAGNTVPTSALPTADFANGTVSAASVSASTGAVRLIAPLTDDLMATSPTAKKKANAGHA